jgi:hypothetical protein
MQWWRRVVDHFRWDNASGGEELDGVRASAPSAVPHAAVHHVSLDQLLERAADRRTQRGGAAH